MVFEDDFELKKEIDNEIYKALLKIKTKYNITFTETNLKWDYNENLYGEYL